MTDEKKIRIVRHLRFLSEVLESFREKQISIGFFLKRAEAFIGAIYQDDNDLSDDLRSFWLDIEVEYAVSLDRKEKITSYEGNIDAALNGMEKLIGKNLRSIQSPNKEE